MGFVTTNALNVVGALLLLRYLGVDEFGRYGIVMALVGIVYGVSDAGLGLTGARELAILPGHRSRSQVLAHLLAMRVVLTGLAVAIAVAFAALAGYDRDLILGTALAGTGTFITSIQSAMLLPLTVELRNNRLAINEVLRQAVLVGTFAVLIAIGAGLVPFFAAQLVVGVVLMLAMPLLLERHHFVRPRWSSRHMRILLQVALPVAVTTVLGVIYLRVLVILMSLLVSSDSQVGDYVTSARVVELVAGLPFLLISVVLPVQAVAAQENVERVRYITARMTETMALGGILIALFVGFAARPIIVILGGQEYTGAVPVLQIQCVAVFTIFLASAWNPSLLALGHVRALVVTTSTGLLTVVVAGLLLIPPLDARGAAVAAVIAEVVLCAATYVALRRAGAADGLVGRRLLGIGVAASLAIVATVLLHPPALLAGFFACALFTAAAFLLRVVPLELVEALPTRRRPARAERA